MQGAAAARALAQLTKPPCCRPAAAQEQQEAEASPEQLLLLARAEQQQLAAANESLQRRLRHALDVRNKGRQHGTRDMSRLDGADARFRCGAGLAQAEALGPRPSEAGQSSRCSGAAGSCCRCTLLPPMSAAARAPHSLRPPARPRALQGDAAAVVGPAGGARAAGGPLLGRGAGHAGQLRGQGGARRAGAGRVPAAGGGGGVGLGAQPERAAAGPGHGAGAAAARAAGGCGCVGGGGGAPAGQQVALPCWSRR